LLLLLLAPHIIFFWFLPTQPQLYSIIIIITMPNYNSQAEALKAQGNDFFKKGQYAAAIERYQQACEVDPNVPAYWSNMAACFEKLEQYQDMADAARSCIKADRNFVKGYFRLATAQKHLNDVSGCIKTLESGLAVDSSNPDLKKMKKEMKEAERNLQVSQYCGKAEEHLQNGDIGSAYKQLELASRLDAGNPSIEALMKRVRPKYEKLEAQRKASLTSDELYKEKGDDCYKAAKFEEAIAEYTKCLDSLERQGKQSSELAMKAYSNRAACHKQLSHFDGTIADCTSVLEVEPDNVKALIRRAQAFEAVERYRFALQDVKTVLSMPYSQVGKSNWDLCNMMQHRLNKTVQQLKAINKT
jgi:stress-induced-phosphoprotein 1